VRVVFELVLPIVDLTQFGGHPRTCNQAAALPLGAALADIFGGELTAYPVGFSGLWWTNRL